MLRPNRGKRKMLKLKLYLLGIILICEPILLFKLVKENDFFKIKNIEIVGVDNFDRDIFLKDFNKQITRPTIEKLFGAENIFSLNTGIQTSTPKYNILKISKNFLTQKITVNVEEIKKAGSWCFYDTKEGSTSNISIALNNDSRTNKTCFWFSGETGNLLGEGLETSGQIYLNIDERNHGFIFPGYKILADSYLNNLKNIFTNLKSNGISISEIDYIRSRNELNILTVNNMKMILSLNFDETSNLEALNDILKKNNEGKISYVDLSIENKIYLKYR